MDLLQGIRRRAPVAAFTVAVLCGWIVSFIYNDWLALCLGLLGGTIAGDLVAAIFRVPETPPPGHIKRPR